MAYGAYTVNADSDGYTIYVGQAGRFATATGPLNDSAMSTTSSLGAGALGSTVFGGIGAEIGSVSQWLHNLLVDGLSKTSELFTSITNDVESVIAKYIAADEQAARSYLSLLQAVGPAQAATAAALPHSGLTLDQLRKIFPRLSAARASQYLPLLNKAMEEAHINTPQRQAAFLAQVSQESGQFRYWHELASGKEYEGRVKGLGNTQPGDGVRFKGRGPIQLTGRANYTQAGKDLGLDLVGNPDQVATPEVGFRTSAWFWNSKTYHGQTLNQLADQGNIDRISRVVNGGDNGLVNRRNYYNQYLGILGP